MAQVEKVVHRYIYPVDLTGLEKEVEKIAAKTGCSKAEAIRSAIKHYGEYVEGLEVIKYRNISKARAEKEIRAYIKGKSRVRADEMSDALRIDMSLVNEILLELWQEGRVEPE